MFLAEIILIAIGLSMDSLAVSVTSGAVLKDCTTSNVVRVAFILAVFQAGMTVAGYVAGLGFEQYIENFDHWIAFLLLLYLGLKMVYESFNKNKKEEEDYCSQHISNRRLCTLGIATSIDALAVGVSLAIIDSPLIPLAVTIGLVTFGFSAFGVFFGCHFGNKTDLKLDLIGGIILIGIGFKILVEHLFFLG